MFLVCSRSTVQHWALPCVGYLDLTFIIKCLKDPSDHFNIFQYIQYVSNNTRACKFKCTFPRSSLNSIHFFYFNRVVRIWNSLPIINLSLSSSTIKKIFSGNISFLLLTLITHVHGFSVVLAICVLTIHP